MGAHMYTPVQAAARAFVRIVINAAAEASLPVPTWGGYSAHQHPEQNSEKPPAQLSVTAAAHWSHFLEELTCPPTKASGGGDGGLSFLFGGKEGARPRL